MSAPIATSAVTLNSGVTDVLCVTPGKDYYVTYNEKRFRLLFAEGEGAVFVHALNPGERRCLGGWLLDRFGGKLSPASIRAFFAKCF